MKQIRSNLCYMLLLFCLSLFLISCGDDDEKAPPAPEPGPPTPVVPTQGGLQVSTDWSNHSPDALLPETCLFRMGETVFTLKADECWTSPDLLNPGKYPLLVYNEAEHITVSGDVATVDRKEDGTLEPLPGYLFSTSQEVTVTAGDTLHTTLKMCQRVHTLTLRLQLAAGDEERIAGTSAMLTGIASSFGLVDGTVTSSESGTLVPAFSIVHENRGRSADSSFLVATVRMAGVAVGESQRLSLAITLSNGGQTAVSADLTESLEDFGNANLPIELEAELSLPVHSGISATIGGWKRTDEHIDIEQSLKTMTIQ